MDVLAGTCIDYLLSSLVTTNQSYSHDRPPAIGNDVALVYEPAVVGLRGTVVRNDTPILSGPHFVGSPYKPSLGAQRRLAKVCVTDITTKSMVNLPHPRLSVCCTSVRVGDVLWLPYKDLKPWDNNSFAHALTSSSSRVVLESQCTSVYNFVRDNDDSSCDEESFNRTVLQEKLVRPIEVLEH